VNNKEDVVREVVSESELGEEKILHSWSSIERPHKKWSKEFYSTVIVLAVLISIIFFFIEGLMLVLVIWAIVFMAWAISKTEPGTREHKITDKGIRTGGVLYRWETMRIYWLEEKWDKKLLRVLLSRFPGQLVLVYGKEDEKKMRKIMNQFVLSEKPEATRIDKIVKWFGEKLPLE
jgi:hypothetical protein